MSEKKGKTELIANVFGIDYKNCSFLECDFHIGCVSFYTNLSSMTAEQSVIIADIHGEINQNLQEESIRKILTNAGLIILQAHTREQVELKTTITNLENYTKARFLIVIRDGPESMTIESENELTKISLPKITEKSEAEKQNIFNKFRTTLISEIRKSVLMLDYKNLVELNEKVII